MYMLRTFCVLFTVMMAVGQTASATEDGRSAACALVQDLGNEAIGQLSDPAISPSQREARFRRLLNDHFDMAAIAKFALGRYWRSTSEAQRVEFRQLFVDFVVASYSARFSDYMAEGFKVTGSSVEDGDTIAVHSKVDTPSSKDIHVDWSLRRSDRNFAIVDVIVEGVSMGVTQRSEFASTIQSRGGVSGLIEALRARNLQFANNSTGQ